MMGVTAKKVDGLPIDKAFATNIWLQTAVGHKIDLTQFTANKTGRCGEGGHILDGVLGAVNDSYGVERCDACNRYTSDFDAAAVLAQSIGPWAEVWYLADDQRGYTYRPARIVQAGYDTGDGIKPQMNITNVLQAQQWVIDYVEENFPDAPDYEVYLVSYMKTLHNWKATLSTSIGDGYFYEISWNGNSQEAYFDAYLKQENRVVVQAVRTLTTGIKGD